MPRVTTTAQSRSFSLPRNVGAASVWEIAIKASLDKIDFPEDDFAAPVTETGFLELRITAAHAAAARRLPRHHRDPFDRMLAVQSMMEGFTLVTRDPVFSLYGVKTMWR